jgi:predicted nucleic acid-binding protein
MNYLVDTNVLSEPRQKYPNRKVIEWLELNESNLYTSVLVIGELRYGIDRFPAGKRRSNLEQWFQRLTQIMAGRVLAINLRVAEEWARLHREIDHNGVALPAVDLLLAATARRHQLVIATANVRDFEMTGVRIVNPFD